MSLFKDIILYNLISFVKQQIDEVQSLQIKKLSPVLKEDDLFSNINIFQNSYVYKSSLEKEWNLINTQATQSVYKQVAEQENIETKRQATLYNAADNLNELQYELSKEENVQDLEDIEEALAEETYKQEQQQQVKQLLAKFYKENHPELTLPEFNYNIIIQHSTELMHDFVLEKQTEYDVYVDSHLVFLSDFFPVNNVDISSLLAAVKHAQLNNIVDSSINIYKAWLRHLRDNNIDYSIYDWNNFNERGEYIGNNSNIDILNKYIDSKDIVIMYDEKKDKEDLEKQFQENVKKILSDGSYKPNFQSLIVDEAKKPRKELYVNQ